MAASEQAGSEGASRGRERRHPRPVFFAAARVQVVEETSHFRLVAFYQPSSHPGPLALDKIRPLHLIAIPADTSSRPSSPAIVASRLGVSPASENPSALSPQFLDIADIPSYKY